MGTFNIGPCECCVEETSLCGDCDDELPDSVLVVVTGVANNATPSTLANCCDPPTASQNCTDCTALNTSYALDRVEPCDVGGGCCCWEAVFEGPEICGDCDGGTAVCRVRSARLHICSVSGIGTTVGFELFLGNDFTGRIANWSNAGSGDTDCLAVLGQVMDIITDISPCNYSGSEAAAS